MQSSRSLQMRASKVSVGKSFNSTYVVQLAGAGAGCDGKPHDSPGQRMKMCSWWLSCVVQL